MPDFEDDGPLGESLWARLGRGGATQDSEFAPEQGELPPSSTPVAPPSTSAGADDSDRLTIGQRIAGAKDAPPRTQVDTPAPAMPKVALDPNAIPPSIRPQQPTPNQVPVPPTGKNNPNLTDLAGQQARLSTPINPMDPATGKIRPEYKLGRGSRIAGYIGNALGAYGAATTGHAFKPIDVSSGATNWRFGREEEQREKQLEGVNTQIKTQEQLDSENEKLYRDAIRQAYEGQLGEARKETAAATQQKADVSSQLADIKQQAVSNQFEEAKTKLEQMAKKAETDADLRQQMINNQGLMMQLRQQIAEGQLGEKQRELEAKYGTGATEKALEDERKARLAAIESDWKEHPYWNKLTGNKTKEVKAVNDEINQRLQRLQGQGSAAGGQPAGGAAGPAPQTHTWSRSAWQRANPKGDVKAAEKQAKAQGFQVSD